MLFFLEINQKHMEYVIHTLFVFMHLKDRQSNEEILCTVVSTALSVRP